ncbi:MAG: tetratricopeptide repeat protein [Stellaceae bacterium]
MKRPLLIAAIALAIAAPVGPNASAQQSAASTRTNIQNGMRMFMAGRYASASHDFRAALHQNPNDPVALLWKGVTLAALGRPRADQIFVLVNNDAVLGGAAEQLLALDDWHRSDIGDAKQVLDTCIHYSDIRWRSACVDMKKGVESGAAAPAVKDWPGDVGLLKVTKARATVWKPKS